MAHNDQRSTQFFILKNGSTCQKSCLKQGYYKEVEGKHFDGFVFGQYKQNCTNPRPKRQRMCAAFLVMRGLGILELAQCTRLLLSDAHQNSMWTEQKAENQ